MKKFFWIFLLSNVTFHLSWPFRHQALPLQCQMLVEGVLYALLTYWLLKKYKDDGEPLLRIMFPLFLGFFWLELPLIRILDFRERVEAGGGCLVSYSKAMRSISFHYHLFTEVEGSKSLIPNNTFLHYSL